MKPTVWIAIALAAGCMPEKPAPQPGGGKPVSLAQQVSIDSSPRDPAPAEQHLFHVDVIRLEAPFGTVALNETFWKSIDEQTLVDVATYDMLYKNGIRIGLAPGSELKHLRGFMRETTVAQKLSVAGAEVRKVEIDVKRDLPEQTIFYFDRRNDYPGRSYDKCSNVLNLSFQPAPRKPGQVRLSLTPMVRADRRRLEFMPRLDEERSEAEIAYVNPETIYDLNLRVDVPPGQILIVSPSSEAANACSVGRAFFTRDGHTERLEQILIFVPQPYKVGPGGKPTAP
ncbi:MAG: hypothetical protein ACREJC_08330 [Tepidisphaeraceae bacterium]